MVAKDFEDHDHVGSIDAVNFEVIEHLNTLFSVRIFWVAFSHTFEKLDLVYCGVRVMICRFNN
jgi:hypothetical protein